MEESVRGTGVCEPLEAQLSASYSPEAARWESDCVSCVKALCPVYGETEDLSLRG